MTPYLLIDTCIWNRLVSPKELSYLLSKLEPLVLEGHIKLLVPKVLLEEWEKHREHSAKEKIDSFFRENNTQAQLKKLFDQEAGLHMEEMIVEAKSKLYSQISSIDTLLTKYAIKIDEPQNVINLIYEHQTSGKEPFHTGKNNLKDARLIFSALNYLSTNGITTLHFVSSNLKDFGEKKQDAFAIFPQIQLQFPSIEVICFEHFKLAHEFIVENYRIPKKQQELPYRKRKLNKIFIDRNKSIIDQVHQYFSVQFEYVDILPKELFLEQYPFLLNEKVIFSRRPYTLTTDNEELYTILTGVEVAKGQLIITNESLQLNNETKEKLLLILRKLRDNLVFFISLRENESTTLAYEPSDVDCDCIECLYHKLRFPALFKRLDEGDANEMESLKAAYRLYKVGSFYESAVKLQALAEARGQKKDTLTFIVNNNLRRLSSVLDFRYWQDSEAMKLTEVLSQIDIEEVISESKASHNHKLLEFIYDSEFHDKAYARISELANKIKDLYYSRSSGSNDNTRQLIEEYTTVVLFLNKNCILFDMYSEFTSLTSLFTESIIASYASKPTLGGKLQYFDDALLKLLLLNGSDTEIRKFMQRYKVGKIEYRFNVPESRTFYSNFSELLNSYDSIEQSPFLKLQKETYFWDDFGVLICNGITICGYLDLNKADLHQVATSILSYASLEKHQHYYNFNNSVDLFLTQHKSLLSTEVLLGFLRLAIAKDSMHDESVFETLTDEIKDRNAFFTFEEEEFEKFKNTFLFDTNTPVEGHIFRLIGYIFSVLKDSSYKKQISRILTDQLKEKFDVKKFYLANGFNMVDYSPDFSKLYEDEILQIADKGQHSSIFSRTDYFSDHRLNEYFNFCFKYNLPIAQSIKVLIPQLGEYYIWLSDIDRYDYRNFNFKWLFNHFTLYYKRKYRESLILKEHIQSILREKNDKDLDRFFINTWCLTEN